MPPPFSAISTEGEEELRRIAIALNAFVKNVPSRGDGGGGGMEITLIEGSRLWLSEVFSATTETAACGVSEPPPYRTVLYSAGLEVLQS